MDKPPDGTDVRVATFNIAMGMEEPGELGEALATGRHPRLVQVAEILQRVRPDILLLNEFDYDPEIDGAQLLNEHYLARSHNGQQPIQYPHSFQASVNTGIDSGLDLDQDGALGGPGDAWGFGRFPGQYGMLVLSRFPLRRERSRSFRLFRWHDLPGANRPRNSDGRFFHPDEIWESLRLSSKSHWDLVFDVGGHDLHFLAYHPTPPVFDGPENRNGWRNYDESRFWVHYIGPGDAEFIVDDRGRTGGIAADSVFVLAGDLNADPVDGDSVPGAVGQLLDHERINSSCIPKSRGGMEASGIQGQSNRGHRGDPASDTADFNDRFAGNLRLDYVLPSRGLTIRDCGVFWPARDEDGHELTAVSDHRLVWLDILL